MDLLEVKDPYTLLKVVEESVKTAFGSYMAIAYYVGQTKLYRLDKTGKSLEELPITGLIYEAIKSNRIEEFKNASQSIQFNLLVDIDRSEAVKCIPISHQKRGGMIMAIEYVNKKQNIIMDKELLRMFIGYICYVFDEIDKISPFNNIIPDSGYLLKKEILLRQVL